MLSAAYILIPFVFVPASLISAGASIHVLAVDNAITGVPPVVVFVL